LPPGCQGADPWKKTGKSKRRKRFSDVAGAGGIDFLDMVNKIIN